MTCLVKLPLSRPCCAGSNLLCQTPTADNRSISRPRFRTALLMTPITRSDLSEYQTSENRLTPRLVPSWRSICSTHPSQTLEVVSPCLFGEIPSQSASSFAMDPSSTLQRTLSAPFTPYIIVHSGARLHYTPKARPSPSGLTLFASTNDVPEKNCQVPIMGSIYQ